MTKYENCKKKIINDNIKNYEKKGKSRKQGIAVALSISEKECHKHMSKKDIEKLNIKVKKFLDNKNKISIAGVLDTIKLNNPKYKQKLLKRFIQSIPYNTHQTNIKVSKLIINYI